MTIPAGGGEQISCCSCYCINHSLNKAENDRTDYFCSWDSLHYHNTLARWSPHNIRQSLKEVCSWNLQAIFITWSFICGTQKRELLLMQSEHSYKYRCFMTGYAEWSISSINLAHLPGIGPLCKTGNFFLPWFLIIIYILPCSKIIFKSNYACCPLNIFISAKYFLMCIPLCFSFLKKLPEV